MPGPVPKRSEERRRRNKPTGPDLAKVSAASSSTKWPDPNPDWHELAVDTYLSLRDSGMAQFYEPSDVAVARYTCEAMSRNLKAEGRLGAQLFSSVLSALTNLGATEGDRRRLRIELDRTEPEVPPSVALMEEYRRAAGAES